MARKNPTGMNITNIPARRAFSRRRKVDPFAGNKGPKIDFTHHRRQLQEPAQACKSNQARPRSGSAAIHCEIEEIRQCKLSFLNV